MNIKEKIGGRITKARKELGITIKELAARTKSLSAARISNWEQGTRSPGPEEAKLVANVLNVSASYLLCLTDSPEGELMLTKANSTKYIPLITMQEAAQAKEKLSAMQEPITLFNDVEKTLVIDRHNKSATSSTLFAVLIEDASMQPEFKIGDIIIVDAELTAQPGDFVLVYLPEKKQTMLRRYAEMESCIFQLQAINGLWTSVNVKHKEDAIIVGGVVEHRRYF